MKREADVADARGERKQDTGELTQHGAFTIKSVIARARYRIYEAEDPLGRPVALRIPTDGPVSTHGARCRLEAVVLSRVEHPAVIRVRQHGTGSEPFIAVDLVRGDSLAQHVARREPSLEDLHRIGAEVLDALDALHTTGVVHRNLSPESIMITRAGEVRLVSFGRATPDRTPASVQQDIERFRRMFLPLLPDQLTPLGTELTRLLRRDPGDRHLPFRSVAGLREAWLDAGAPRDEPLTVEVEGPATTEPFTKKLKMRDTLRMPATPAAPPGP